MGAGVVHAGAVPLIERGTLWRKQCGKKSPGLIGILEPGIPGEVKVAGDRQRRLGRKLPPAVRAGHFRKKLNAIVSDNHHDDVPGAAVIRKS
jgi:hypothetical protein